MNSSILKYSNFELVNVNKKFDNTIVSDGVTYRIPSFLSSDLITILNSHLSKKYPNITVLNCFDTTNRNGKSNSVLKSYHMRYSSYIMCDNNVYTLIVKDTDLNTQVEIALTRLIPDNKGEKDFFMQINPTDRMLYIVDKNDKKYAKFDKQPPQRSSDTGYLIIPDLFICLLDDYGVLGIYYFLISNPNITPEAGYVIDIKIKLLYTIVNDSTLAPTKFYSFSHSKLSELNYNTDSLNVGQNSSNVDIYNSLYFCALDVNYDPVYLLKLTNNYLTNKLQAYPEGFLNLSLNDTGIDYDNIDYNKTPDQDTYNIIPTVPGLLKSGDTAGSGIRSTGDLYIPKNGYIKIVNITPKDANVAYYMYKSKRYYFYLDLSEADKNFNKKDVTKVYKTVYNVMNGYVLPVERKDSIITNLGLTSFTLSSEELSPEDKRGDIEFEYLLGFDYSLIYHNTFILYINSDYSYITRKITTITDSEIVYDINKCNTNKIKIKCMCQSIQSTSNSTINTFIGVSDDNKVYVANVIPSPATPEPWGRGVTGAATPLFSFINVAGINIKIINTIKIDTITTYYVIDNNNKFYIYYGPKSPRNYNLTSSSGASTYWVEVSFTFYDYNENLITGAKILQIFPDIDKLNINRYIALVQYNIPGGTETCLFSSITLMDALKFKLGLNNNNKASDLRFINFFAKEKKEVIFGADASTQSVDFNNMYFVYSNCGSYNCFTKPDPSNTGTYNHYKLSEQLEYSASASEDPVKKGNWVNINTAFKDTTLYSYALNVYMNTMDSLFIRKQSTSTVMYLYGYGTGLNNNNNQYAIYSLYATTDINNTTYIQYLLVNYIVNLTNIKNIFNIVNTYYSTNVPTGVTRIVPPEGTVLKNSNEVTMMDIYNYSKSIIDSTTNKKLFYNYIAICKYKDTDDAEIHYLTLK